MTQYHTNGKKSSSDEEPGDDGPNGFVPVARKLHDPSFILHPRNPKGIGRENWLFRYEELAFSAAWKDQPARNLRRGEVRVGQKYWAGRWDCSRKEVRHFLGRIEELGLIQIEETGPFDANKARILDYDDLFAVPGSGARGQGEGPRQRPKSSGRTEGQGPGRGARARGHI